MNSDASAAPLQGRIDIDGVELGEGGPAQPISISGIVADAPDEFTLGGFAMTPWKVRRGRHAWQGACFRGRLRV